MTVSHQPAHAPRRATLKDVARAAGVSQSTTSRALNGQGYVAPAVRERVRAAAEELGYVPSVAARSLRQQVSRSIGVLVSDVRLGFYADLALGVAARAAAHGYTMMLVDDRGSARDELGAARAFVATRAAGVVVAAVSAAVPSYLLAQQIPLVEVERQFLPGASDAVVVDNRRVAREVTERLLALGHRRIALLVDETVWTTGSERIAGHRDALAAAGLPDPPELLVRVHWDVEKARLATLELLARADRPTAVVAADDVLAEGMWRAVLDRGLRVPEDVSLVSFDDARWMDLVQPGVTAVTQDVPALAAAAVDRLLGRIERPDEEPQTVTLSAGILSRGSTAVPALG